MRDKKSMIRRLLKLLRNKKESENMYYLDHFRIWVMDELPVWMKEQKIKQKISTASSLPESLFLDFVAHITKAHCSNEIKDYSDVVEHADYLRIKKAGGTTSIAKKAIVDTTDSTYVWFDADEKINSFFTNYNFSDWVGKHVKLDALDHYTLYDTDLDEFDEDEYTIITYMGQIVGHNEDHLIMRGVYGSIHQKTEEDQEFPLGIARLTKDLMFVVKSLITRIDVMASDGWIFKNDHISADFFYNLDIMVEITETGFIS